jgi:hypothetical protein
MGVVLPTEPPHEWQRVGRYPKEPFPHADLRATRFNADIPLHHRFRCSAMNGNWLLYSAQVNKTLGQPLQEKHPPNLKEHLGGIIPAPNGLECSPPGVSFG